MYYYPEAEPVLRQALQKMGRRDLIGNGEQQLIPGNRSASILNRLILPAIHAKLRA